MSRMVQWLQRYDKRLFFWFNHMLQHGILNRTMHTITHIGGATFTILFCLAFITFAPSANRWIGVECLTALALSHIPVAFLKRKYPRLRPYLVLPQTRTCKYPLKDHSFPSGHTTAVFSVSVPLITAFPLSALYILPIALTVAISRMVLGLHYPSDVIAGATIGILTSAVTIQLIPM